MVLNPRSPSVRDLPVPGDVLLFRPMGWGILLPLVKLLITWGHVAVYYTETKRGLPLIIESIGRGVMIRSLLAYQGKRFRLMRPQEELYGEKAAKLAERIADNPRSWYDYWSIPVFVLPKLILIKFGRWLPPRIKIGLTLVSLSYRRNSLYICSELLDQIYRDSGYPLVGEKTIPLPDDIARSPRLKDMGEFVVEGSKIARR